MVKHSQNEGPNLLISLSHKTLPCCYLYHRWFSTFSSSPCKTLEPLRSIERHLGMQVERLSSDRINTLPQNINEQILSLLPIQDAVRTSIFSKKWRYYWASIPEFEFQERTFQVSSNSECCKKYKFVNAILHVLMLRMCPLLHFSLYLGQIKMNSEVDQIILYLSLSNPLKSFFLSYTTDNMYKLPSSLFSFQRLEKLQIVCCVFEPPLTFNGFSMMRNLSFDYVDITTKALQHLLVNSPLLEKLELWELRPLFIEGNEFTGVELLGCLPSIVELGLSNNYIEYFATGDIPPRISPSLAHLKYIFLEVCLMSQDELSLVLCLIRSSPKLYKLDILITTEDLLVQQASINSGDLQDCLNHLEYLVIRNFSSMPIEMEFVKLIMAKSPMLKKVRIMLFSTDAVCFTVDDELKIFKDLTRHLFPCASPTTEVTVESCNLCSF